MRYNRNTLMLGLIAAIISAWGLWTLLSRAGAPWYIAILGTFIIEGFAVGVGNHAVTVANDGDDPMPFIGITVAITIVAAAIQFFGAVSEGKGWVAGMILAMAPTAAITLWTLEVNRHNRVIARVKGRIQVEAPAHIDVRMKRAFPKAARRAELLALADRSLTADDAMTTALNELGMDEAPAVVTGKVRRNLTLNALATAPAAITAEVVETKEDGTPTATQVASNGHAKGATVPATRLKL